MKKLFGLIAIVGLCWGGYKVFAGPNRAERAHKACANMAEVCDVGMTAHDVAECTADLQDPPKEISKDAVDKLASCASSANSCGEVIGCFAGVGADLDSDLRDFGKGFDRARKH
jgi:hypothetical protein